MLWVWNRSNQPGALQYVRLNTHAVQFLRVPATNSVETHGIMRRIVRVLSLSSTPTAYLSFHGTWPKFQKDWSQMYFAPALALTLPIDSHARMPQVASLDDIEWASPDSVTNCLKEIKTGGNFVSFGWCDPKLGESGDMLDELCAVLGKSKKIQALDLDNANLSNSSIEAICEALKKNKSLHTLILTNNDLGAPAAKAIDDLLKLNKVIKTINLGDNPKIPAHMMQSINSQLEGR